MATLTHWVHSEFSRPALNYATFLFHDQSLLSDRHVNADESFFKAKGWEAHLPFSVMYPKEHPSVLLEVAEVDMGNRKRLAENANLDAFDTFVTISFEHFGDDLGLIRDLPQGSNFVFGVPNFDSCCGFHFRWFDNEKAIHDRYNGVLDIKKIQTVHAEPHQCPGKCHGIPARKYVVHGVVRR
eukprot:gnl/MRDRNA2_/MRDRNA2_239577_c0_seq1.p1 gnl/MRDRNA2_/MRDRNA2_239577_c0~~gnl/MRDRNA2_/MRDRNA2_239577_c0_seq1.p1  ORF type:complete len:211 (+),score=19.35 gnl/MRDRNA2_/MRDRNA2_239577_c0_seq1:85-633(+)